MVGGWVEAMASMADRWTPGAVAPGGVVCATSSSLGSPTLHPGHPTLSPRTVISTAKLISPFFHLKS